MVPVIQANGETATQKEPRAQRVPSNQTKSYGQIATENDETLREAEGLTNDGKESQDQAVALGDNMNGKPVT